MLSICTPSHNPKYLSELWDCLKKQTLQDFEWVILGQRGTTEAIVLEIVGSDPRVKFNYSEKEFKGIGEIKRTCFMSATGDYLLEVDHDDLLTADALEKVDKAFKESGADFVYSDCADFSPTGELVTYHNSQVLKGWEDCGWTFYEVEIEGKKYKAPNTWKPSAQSISLVYYAPNHIRAWKREFYHKIGGHNPEYEICDDHELIIRTYLEGTMHHIPEVLYLYRVETNTWSSKIQLIAQKTNALKNEYLERLVLRECELSNLPAIELGGGINPREGWISCDIADGQITSDLNEKWPFEDGSVGAFRANDTFEHLKDKQHVMKELYRCLKPGGWVLSQTPSALGAGGYCDPTHVSYWVKRHFNYYTHRETASFIRNTSIRFMPVDVYEYYPSNWHKQEQLLYVVGNLIKLHETNEKEIPGIKYI